MKKIKVKIKPKKKVKLAKAKREKVVKVDDRVLLTAPEEEFCRLWATDKDFFGNGVQSYIEAFDVDMTAQGAYNRAKAAAYDLLTKPYILEKINEILELYCNDEFVDKQLAVTITQNADFNAKVKAIGEYNKIKGRVIKKLQHSGTVAYKWEDDD